MKRLLTGIALGTLLGFGWLFHPQYVQAPPGAAGLASQLMVDAMVYHGVGWAPYDLLRGAYGFERDGQWCQLFTAKFLDTQDWREW